MSSPSVSTTTQRGPGPVRVVHLIGQLGRGGSERQLYLVLRHLDPERVRSEVIVFNPSPHAVYDEPLRRCGVPVHAVPTKLTSPLARLPWVRRRIAAAGAEIVHSWTVHDNPYAVVCGRLAGARAAWGSLRGAPDSTTLRQLSRPLRWLALRAPQRLVVNSPHLARRLAAEGHSAEKLCVLPNCIEETADEDVDGAAAADLPFPAGTRLVGSIGNLRAVKNHPLLIRALARVLPDRPDVGAVIVGQSLPGEPDLPRRLEEQIEAAGLAGRVVLTGFRDDVPAILRRLALACLTSTSEGTPNVLLEAMAAGCPVVATRVGGVPDLVADGDTGLLVPSDDAAALAEAIARLLDQPARAAELATRARRAVRTSYGCDRIADRLASLYEQAVGGPDRGSSG